LFTGVGCGGSAGTDDNVGSAEDTAASLLVVVVVDFDFGVNVKRISLVGDGLGSTAEKVSFGIDFDSLRQEEKDSFGVDVGSSCQEDKDSFGAAFGSSRQEDKDSFGAAFGSKVEKVSFGVEFGSTAERLSFGVAFCSKAGSRVEGSCGGNVSGWKETVLYGVDFISNEKVSMGEDCGPKE